MDLLNVLTAAWAVLALAVGLHHKPSLDCVEALGSGRGVTRFTVDRSRRGNVEVRWLLLPVELIIHNDGVHVLAVSSCVLFQCCYVVVYVFLRWLSRCWLRVQ